MPPVRDVRPRVRHLLGSARSLKILDERLAERLWPNESAIGKRIRTVIGVAGHVHQERLDSIGREQVYLPFSQRLPPYARSLFVAVKTDADPELAVFGIAIGTVGAAAGARVLGSLLFGIDTFDEVAFLGSSGGAGTGGARFELSSGATGDPRRSHRGGSRGTPPSTG